MKAISVALPRMYHQFVGGTGCSMIGLIVLDEAEPVVEPGPGASSSFITLCVEAIGSGRVSTWTRSRSAIRTSYWSSGRGGGPPATLPSA